MQIKIPNSNIFSEIPHESPSRDQLPSHPQFDMLWMWLKMHWKLLTECNNKANKTAIRSKKKVKVIILKNIYVLTYCSEIIIVKVQFMLARWQTRVNVVKNNLLTWKRGKRELNMLDDNWGSSKIKINFFD